MSDNENDQRAPEEASAVENKECPQVKIVLQGSQDNRTIVLAKRTTKISRLLSAFCKERNVNSREFRLVYKGKVMQEDEEVGNYNMRDNDVIEVVASQTGGSS